jgi:hypothetical protein
VNNTTNPVVNTPSSNTSGKALNPAHGQPGHRCDIPVGSPLDQPVSQPTMTTTTTTPASPTLMQPATQQVPTTTTTGTGLNPAHGQPGHRCDIPVGSPLSSKPTLTTVPATN